MNRRKFIRNTSIAASALALTGSNAFSIEKKLIGNNPLPQWKGFNLLDYFGVERPKNPDHNKTKEEDFKWMVDWGFDFVRIPMAYPRYLKFDQSKNITPDQMDKFDNKVLDEVDKLIFSAQKHGLHVSLNLHRAPGYCINAGFYEPFNLWKDKEAKEAFYSHWGMWAKRYKNISKEKLSFDLLNEPAYRDDLNDQYSKSSALPGELYREVAQGAAKSIRTASPDRLIIADGNNVGNSVTPELIDLKIGQSCRGYFPHYVSHYQAPWVFKDPSTAPMPVWPGKIDGKDFGKAQLEEYYKPWIDLASKGVGVHCGECGCWRNTPHEVFLAWFGDILDILGQNKIGFALWNFRGEFGILDSGRKDVNYEDWFGHKLDRKLLNLLQKK